MKEKFRIRKKYLLIRKKKYFEIKSSFFNPLLRLIQKKIKKNKISIFGYYPASYEVNILKIFNTSLVKNLTLFLPVIDKNNGMSFHKWKKNDVLCINRYGMPEPAIFSNYQIPDIIMVPLIAFDNQNNRLGYGKGYYDLYLGKFLKKNKNIITIGVAFSFQKHHKLPTTSNDVKLNYVLTEKGIK